MPEQVPQDSYQAELTFDCGCRTKIPWDLNTGVETFACEEHLESGDLGYEGKRLLTIART